MSAPEAPLKGWPELTQLRRRLLTAALAFHALLAVGVAGYMIIDPQATVMDALYMTVITLTTVGYGEVVDLSGGPQGRLFTMTLLILGLGIATYFVSTATALVVDGHLRRAFWRRRMQKLASRLTGHHIVCGTGETALHASAELHSTGRPFVLICAEASQVDRLRQQFPDGVILEGDPTLEHVLLEAGVKRAAGLLAATEQDKDNVIITLAARQANGRMRIVARATGTELESMLRKVGADAVVSTTRIGGLRLVSELVRPTVVTFLDKMLRDQDKRLRVEEVALPRDSPYIGIPLGDIDFRSISNALLMAAYVGQDGNWLYNPPPMLILDSGVTLILMGSPDDIERVRAALSGGELAPAEVG